MEMRVHLTLVDTGGEDGVQDRAYDWWRSLRQHGLSSRVLLLKGGSAKNAPNTQLRYPSSDGRKDRKSNARGDVPVLFINTNKIKDILSNDLQRQTVGPGYIHFPDWLQDWFYKELKSEARGGDGTWNKVSARNEAWDLLVYMLAALNHLGIVNGRINWEAPPKWLSSGNENPEIITAAERRELKSDASEMKIAAATRGRGRVSSFRGR